MRFTRKGARITLHGLKADLSKCTAISAGKIKGLIRRGALTHCIQMWQDLSLLMFLIRMLLFTHCLNHLVNGQWKFRS